MPWPRPGPGRQCRHGGQPFAVTCHGQPVAALRQLPLGAGLAGSNVEDLNRQVLVAADGNERPLIAGEGDRGLHHELFLGGPVAEGLAGFRVPQADAGFRPAENERYLVGPADAAVGSGRAASVSRQVGSGRGWAARPWPRRGVAVLALPRTVRHRKSRSRGRTCQGRPAQTETASDRRSAWNSPPTN